MTDIVFASAAVFVAITAFVLWIGGGVLRARLSATSRLAAYGTQELRDDTLRQPLSQRAIAPLVLAAGRFVSRFVPGSGWTKRTDQRIVYAGLQSRLDANSWVVIKVLSVLASIGLVAVMTRFVTGDLGRVILLGGLILILGVFTPDVWLNRRIDDRRRAMQRSLPDMLDLLVISVEAGLGFDSALARVVDTVPGPLAEEFFRMLQETRVGVSRREAMRHLMERTDLEELRSFLLAMMQAEAFGVAIARVLRVQADEMRIKRRQIAQEKAFGAPVKMVFPLVLCIFPTLFVVLLGPAGISIWDNFVNR